MGQLSDSQAYEDPAGTARWAIQLPYDAARDPAATATWLKTQLQDAPWFPHVSK